MFEGLLSNTRMKTELARAIAEQRPMHAYLFCGADGSGKLTAAKLLATELVGGDRGKAERGTHPDIFILEPEKDKKTISVAQVREMRNDAFVNPSEGKRKIYIINGVQLMNDAGQNALLTILEQPPSFAIFILLSESREKVLATVVSRCAVFEMEYVTEEDGAKFLQTEFPDVSYDRLVMYMNAAEGNIGFAKKLASGGEFDTLVLQCGQIAQAMAAKNEYAVAKILCKKTKDTLPEFLPILALVLKDILVYRSTGQMRPVFKEILLQNRSEFDKIDINTLYDGVSECENSLRMLGGNVSAMLIGAVLTIRLCGGKQID